MPVCQHCHHDLPVVSFHRADRSETGLHKYCMSCLVESPELKFAPCSCCHRKRDLRSFENLDPSAGVCAYCCVGAGTPAIAVLRDAPLHHHGLHTVRELLFILGYTDPSKGELNAASRWLKGQGFRRLRSNGTTGYRVSVSSNDSRFAEWAAAFPGAVDRLGLSSSQIGAYMRGAPRPAWLSLAMSAISAGLPPYESTTTTTTKQGTEQ